MPLSPDFPYQKQRVDVDSLLLVGEIGGQRHGKAS